MEQEHSLRERKFVKTKVALMQAFMERLKTTRFNNISIKEVCDSVEVSEGTFYNYFPQKIDIVYYYKSFVSVKVAWEINRKQDKMRPLELIGYVFELIADELQPPYMFYEMVSIFTGERRRPDEIPLSELEKEYAYPDCEGIKDVGIGKLEDLFAGLIKRAQEQQEINVGIDEQKVLLSLMTILIGTPLVIELEDFSNMKYYFQDQLSFLYKAIGVK